MESLGSLRSVSRTSILSVRPSRLAAMRTLRPNGEAGDERNIIMREYFAVAAAGKRPAAVGFQALWRMAHATGVRIRVSSAHDQIDRLGPFALLVGFDIEADLLAFIQALHSGCFDRGDVHEHIARAVVRFDETISSLRIKKLNDSSLRHRVFPPPHCSTTGPTHGGSARTFTNGESVSLNRPLSLRRPPRGAERHCQGSNYTPTMRLRKEKRWPAREQRRQPPARTASPASQSSLKPPPRGSRSSRAASAGKSTAKSSCKVQGGLTRMSPEPFKRVELLTGETISSARRILPTPRRLSRLASASASPRPLIGYHKA